MDETESSGVFVDESEGRACHLFGRNPHAGGNPFRQNGLSGSQLSCQSNNFSSTKLLAHPLTQGFCGFGRTKLCYPSIVRMTGQRPMGGEVMIGRARGFV